MANLGIGDVGNWYKNTLGREGDPQGLSYWKTQLEAPGADPNAIRNQFTQAAAKEYNGAGSNPWEDMRVAGGMNSVLSGSPYGSTYADYNKAINPDSYNMSIADRYAQPAQTTQPTQQNNSPTTGGPRGYDQKNPYLADMGRSITSQVNDNWTRNIAPSLRSGAMATGGFGGSRQGVVEANAAKDINQGLSNSLTNMYYGDYNNQMNRNLQQYGMDQGYDLGLRNNDLGFGQLDLGINQANFNNNLAGANFGRSVWQDQMANNGLGIGAATNIQNTPQDYFNNFSNSAYRAGGLGGTGEDKKTNNGSWLNTALGLGSLFF